MTTRLAIAFFASGAAALLFQVLWFRALGRVLGNTVWAGAAVLTAFMLGMAIGGLLAARWARRIRRPARAFALAEAVVALSGSLLVWCLPLLEPLAAQWLPGIGARFTLALAVLLLPTVAMGTTLALGVRVLAHQRTARALGVLYAANTFGACLAPLAAEFWLIEVLGLRGTALTAAGLNLLAATLALALPAAAAAPAAPAPASPALPWRLLLAAAIAGGLALALEVIWFRLLVLYALGSDEAFAIMLSVVLAGIALGGALAPALTRVRFAWIAAAGCLAVVLGYLLAGWAFGRDPDIAVRALLLMLPAALVSGALFTLLGAGLRAGADNPQPAIGALTTANTIGAALGATLAALVLLPQLGIEWSLFVLAAGYALLPLLVAARPAVALAAPLAVAAAALATFPFGRMTMHLEAAAMAYRVLDGGAQVVHVAQGPTTTLQLLRRERFGEPLVWRLVTDNYSMTAINGQALRYMQLFAWLPYALHPEPRRALLISYGAGNTAQALLSEPRLGWLTVVDVSPEILGTSPLIHGKADPLRDARVRLVMEDGRHYLRAPGEQYDVITAEPPPPWAAGVVNLYTREYFMALAARLAPGGLATYWLPVTQFRPEGVRATVRAFCEAFPDCTLWAGNERNWVLMGGREFAHRPDARHFSRLWHDPKAAPRLAAGGFESAAQLGAAFLADAAQLRAWYGKTDPLTDDYPKRIASQGEANVVEDYAAWLRPDGARRRFQESQWVARHWPPEHVSASLPYFAVQPVLNGEMAVDPLRNLPQVDLLLRRTDLRVPVLWLLSSDVTEQEIVARKLAAGGYRSEYAYPLGVRALSERDYATAAKAFTDASRQLPVRAGALAAYSLCRAGRPSEAAAAPGAGALPRELRCF